jgi:hypothetical protein
MNLVRELRGGVISDIEPNVEVQARIDFEIGRFQDVVFVTRKEYLPKQVLKKMRKLGLDDPNGPRYNTRNKGASLK